MTSRGLLSRRRFLASSAGAAALATSASLVMSSPAGARSSDRFLVNANGARLRSGPGTGYRVLASFAKGTEVRYLASGGRANGYDWAKVQVVATGATGFIAFQLLSPIGSNQGAAVKVASGPLNVRTSPNGSIIRTVATGVRGRVTDQMPQEANGYVWVNVQFEDQAWTRGWVVMNFLPWL